MAREEIELLEMGVRIAELRKRHGFKQQWIADQVGVQLRTYQFWQQGKSPPEQDNLEKLAALFKVDPGYILNGVAPEVLDGSQMDRIEAKVDELLELLTNAQIVRVATRDDDEGDGDLLVEDQPRAA